MYHKNTRNMLFKYYDSKKLLKAIRALSSQADETEHPAARRFPCTMDSHASARQVCPLLGGSWVLMSRVISRATMVLT